MTVLAVIIALAGADPLPTADRAGTPPAVTAPTAPATSNAATAATTAASPAGTATAPPAATSASTVSASAASRSTPSAQNSAAPAASSNGSCELAAVLHSQGGPAGAAPGRRPHRRHRVLRRLEQRRWSTRPASPAATRRSYPPSGQYWGWYQFDYGTWVAHGGAPSGYGNAPLYVQHQVAARVNYDAWPNC